MKVKDIQDFFSSDATQWGNGRRFVILLEMAADSRRIGKTKVIDKISFKFIHRNSLDEYRTQAVFEAKKKGEEPLVFAIAGDMDSWGQDCDYTSYRSIYKVKPKEKTVTTYEVIK